MPKHSERARRSSVLAALGGDVVSTAPSVESAPKFPPPSSSRQSAAVALSCLQQYLSEDAEGDIVPKRILRMLEDTAQSLLDDDAKRAAPSDPDYSDAESHGAFGASPRRWLAARFLLLASHAGLARGTVSALRASVLFAEKALAAHRCPATTTHLAWCCYALSRGVQERGGRERLEAMARDLTRGAAHALERRSFAPMDALLLVRLAWLGALLGDREVALGLARRVLSSRRAEVDALLLLALLRSADGDYPQALDVAQHAEQLRPRYVAGGLLLAALRHAASAPREAETDASLAVCLARVQSADAPPNAPVAAADGVWSGRRRQRARVAGHWALLAHTAAETGAAAVAEVAVEAGVQCVSSAPSAPRRAFADLLCTGARLRLDRVARLVDGRRRAQRGAVAALREYEEERRVETQRALLDQNEVLATHAMLERALTVCPAHAEAYLLLGRLHHLEALRPEQAHRSRETHLAEAAHYFQSAIRCDATLIGAYEGMGRVREAQGALEMSLSFLSSAAELSCQQPIIAYDRFLYLLN